MASGLRNVPPSAVPAAIRAGRVVLLLFYNPQSSLDRALRDELAALPVSGRVLKTAVPINDLVDYPVITAATTINETPEFVLVNTRRRLSTIDGFADGFELQARVGQALAGR